MRWPLAMLALAACASPQSPEECAADEPLQLAPPDAQLTVGPPAPAPVVHAPPPAPWKPAPPVEIPAPPVQPAVRGAVVAPPSQAIRAIAVDADGTVAVSADVGGNVRLWPALDGSREPVVIAMRRPGMLAIMHAGSDLAIAGIDGAGQLELVEIGPLGEPGWRKPVELARPVIDVRATQTGFLVETDDQHLAFVDLAARLEGEVEPPSGTDIVAIAVTGNRMLALLSGGGAVHGRWLVVNGWLQWGEQTAALPIAPRGIALSPDATMVAGIVEDSATTRLAIVGLEHADRRAISVDDQFVDPTLRPVRWADDTRVVTSSSSGLSLWRIADSSLDVMANLPGPAIATDGGSLTVVGSGTELALVDRNGAPRFLGFRMPGLTSLVASPRSLLASDGRSVIRLGEDLREYASYDVTALYGTNSTSVIALLDAGHVLVQFYTSESRLDVVALDTLESMPIDETSSQWLGYDRATRLAAFLYDTTVRFRRFDPGEGAFGPAAELTVEPGSSSVAFSDGGAFVTTYTEKGYVTRTVTKIRPEHETLTVARTHRQSFTTPADTVLGPAAPALRSVKSPDGSLTARIGNNRISLRDAEGVRWTVAARGAYDLVWLGKGELLAIGAGIARVDLDTGEIVERRCGWEFGLWTQRFDAFPSALMCDAE